MLDWLFSKPLAVGAQAIGPDGVVRYARRGKPAPPGVLAAAQSTET